MPLAYPPKMRGATSGVDGGVGLVPKPAAGDQDKQLHGDGTFRASASASAATNAQAVLAASTSTFLTPANAEYAVGQVRNALSPRGGISFDGTAAAKATATLTSQNIGTDPFSVVLTFKVPTAVTGNNIIAILDSSSTGADAARELFIYIPSTGSLRVFLYGATTSDYRYNEIASFVTNYGGKSVQVAVTRTGATLAIYINGVAQTLGADATAGTPPAWSDTVTSTYLHLGSGPSSTEFKSSINQASVYNLALAAADVLEIYELGGAVPFRYQFGSQVAVKSSDFSAGADGWGADAPNVVAGNVDSINGQDDWLSVKRTTSTGGLFSRAAAGNSFTAAASGKAVRFRGSIWNPAGSAITYLQAYINNAVGTPQGTAFAIAANTQVDYDETFIAPFGVTSDYYGFRTSKLGGGMQSVAAGQIFYQKTVMLHQVGAVVHLALDDGIGYQLHDQSTNKLDATRSVSGVSHLIPKRDGYVRTAGTGLSWSGTHESKSVLGQRALPDGAVVTLITRKSSGASSGSGCTIGTTNDATRWQTADTFTTAKEVASLAAQLPAGTADADTDILIDPDTANITATIAVEVHYKLTEG